MVRENGDNQEDGADEKMLEGDEKSQLARKDEVKFISGEHPNGDAKIDIGNIEKVSFFFCLNSAEIFTPNMLCEEVTPK